MITAYPPTPEIDNQPLTAFGDLRVAELSPIFQGTFEYTVENTEILDNVVAAGGTVTQSSGMGVVSTSTTTASTALMQSHTLARYRAGLGGVARFTALFTSPVADTEQYAGLADTVGSSAAFKNGYMIGYDGSTFGFHRFQNDVKISVAQSEWDDPLDGTGPSGMTLDQTKINVFFIQYQYLGAGAIKLFAEDDSTGGMILVHTIDFTNANTSPSVFNPNFHITFFVDNKATTSDIIIKSSSYAYFTEGKTQQIEIHQPQFTSELLTKAAVTTEVAIFTIRNKANYVSKENFIDIFIERIVASIEANAANNLGQIRLIKNATLGGTPSFVNINESNSVVDIDVAGTTVTGGKTVLTEPMAGKNDKVTENLTPYTIILQAGDTLTVAGTSANSATVNAALLWKELF